MSRRGVLTLPRWVAALNAQRAIKIDIGTSSVQGANATDHNRRYHEIDRIKITKNLYSNKQIEYYSPQSDLVNTYTSYFTYTDNSGSHALVSEGLSLRTVTLTNGASVSITITGSAVSFLFVQGSAYGQGNVSIDGGTATQWPTDPRTGDNHDGQYDVTGLAYGSHTVALTAPVNGSVKFTGLIVHNYAGADLTKGIYSFNSGHGGFTTSNFAADTYLYDRIKSLKPHLVTYMPGTNDYGSNMDIVTYTSNVQTVLNKIRSNAPNADMLLVTPYKRLDVVGLVPWQNYRDANAALASINQCAYIDVTDFYPDSQAHNSAGLIDPADWLHQTDAGHSYGARLFYPLLI